MCAFVCVLYGVPLNVKYRETSSSPPPKKVGEWRRRILERKPLLSCRLLPNRLLRAPPMSLPSLDRGCILTIPYLLMPPHFFFFFEKYTSRLLDPLLVDFLGVFNIYFHARLDVSLNTCWASASQPPSQPLLPPPSFDWIGDFRCLALFIVGECVVRASLLRLLFFHHFYVLCGFCLIIRCVWLFCFDF